MGLSVGQMSLIIQTQLLFFSGRWHPELYIDTEIEALEGCEKMLSTDILKHYISSRPPLMKVNLQRAK